MKYSLGLLIIVLLAIAAMACCEHMADAQTVVPTVPVDIQNLQMYLGNPNDANTVDHEKLLEYHKTYWSCYKSSETRSIWYQYTIPAYEPVGKFPFYEVGDMSIPAGVDKGAWAGFDNYLLNLSYQGFTTYVLTGPGYGFVWKIVMISTGRRDQYGVDYAKFPKVRVIAIIVPTDGTALSDWTKYKVAGIDIKNKTGLDILNGVGATAQVLLLANKDEQP